MVITDVFFFNDTATTEIYTLSLHDALPIYDVVITSKLSDAFSLGFNGTVNRSKAWDEEKFQDTKTWWGSALYLNRSEEHTSELQSRQYLVCRLLLEKKKKHK